MKKVLIANRSEIAVRVIRACRELGLETVAIYSEADARSAHVALADDAYALQGSTIAETYLDQEQIFRIARDSNADSIHPGFGFLSENANFARACQKNNICFIGPDPKTIEMMGDKLKARALMQKAKVPIVPGSEGAITDLQTAREIAKKIKFPIMLKAAAGGGGKGMRLVENMEQLEASFESTVREAQNYFGDGSVFLEKFIESPHHIEVQVLGDKHGNIVHLFERECSMQRRHQKVIEEAPAPFLEGYDSIREDLFAVAVQGAKSVAYDSVGTIEFIVDKDRNFYFLEMNTRIQVEHPVTEWITGIDLVKEQILVARGDKLRFKQAEIKKTGVAIESRLYAEDPCTFLPATGEIVDTVWPGGPFVRLDHAIFNKSFISMDYDPMIAKISTWGQDRDESIARMRRALKETMIAGVVSNLPFLIRAIEHPKFISGDYATSFIAEFAEDLIPVLPEEQLKEILALCAELEVQNSDLISGKAALWLEDEHV